MISNLAWSRIAGAWSFPASSNVTCNFQRMSPVILCRMSWMYAGKRIHRALTLTWT